MTSTQKFRIKDVPEIRLFRNPTKRMYIRVNVQTDTPKFVSVYLFTAPESRMKIADNVCGWARIGSSGTRNAAATVDARDFSLMLSDNVRYMKKSNAMLEFELNLNIQIMTIRLRCDGFCASVENEMLYISDVPELMYRSIPLLEMGRNVGDLYEQSFGADLFPHFRVMRVSSAKCRVYETEDIHLRYWKHRSVQFGFCFWESTIVTLSNAPHLPYFTSKVAPLPYIEKYLASVKFSEWCIFYREALVLGYSKMEPKKHKSYFHLFKTLYECAGVSIQYDTLSLYRQVRDPVVVRFGKESLLTKECCMFEVMNRVGMSDAVLADKRKCSIRGTNMFIG